MEMYEQVTVVLNQRGWELETELTPKADVTKFTVTVTNDEKYIPESGSGQTLSLHYDEYEELCLVKETLNAKLHLSDEISTTTTDVMASTGYLAASSTIVSSRIPSTAASMSNSPIAAFSSSSSMWMSTAVSETTEAPIWPWILCSAILIFLGIACL
ncbi:uncharacterized protein LOC117335355 [Pecten maximus]|uniref:uncharacterized protein LOC117335355 n=1 Tax=Pecten maximus TaxID=6579 RepID=UPI00145846A3|nr:uncharacterized protein LOC117335355 [Pecten maximus]XP_033751185.1 uncharacterized protein LOC117335355 [Pecten maximus]